MANFVQNWMKKNSIIRYNVLPVKITLLGNCVGAVEDKLVYQLRVDESKRQ